MCWPNRLSRGPGRVACCLVEAGPPDTEQALHIPVAFSQLYQDAVRLGLRDRARAAPRRPRALPAARPRARRLVVAERDDLHPRQPRATTTTGATSATPAGAGTTCCRTSCAPRTTSAAPSRLPRRGRAAHASPTRARPPARARVRRGGVARRPDRRTPTSTGGEQDGVGLYQLTQRNGMRCSTAVAYLHPVARAPEPDARADGARHPRCCSTARAPSGVDAARRRADRRCEAEREVMLCAGAYQLAAAADALRHRPGRRSCAALGIDVRLDQPAVGANLHDHLNAADHVAPTTRRRSMTAETAENVALLQTHGRGPLTSNVAEAGGFWRSRDGLDAPDVQFHFAPVMFAEEGLLRPAEHACSVGACVLKPRAAASVRLRSADPPPSRASSPELPRQRARTGRTRSPASAHAASRSRARRRDRALRAASPTRCRTSDSDADLRAYVRANAHHLYHPVGTCAHRLAWSTPSCACGHRRPARGGRLGDADVTARQHERARRS